MSKNEAQEALFDKITDLAKRVDFQHGQGASAVAIRDLALAYRYAAGGSQPGSVTVEK